MSKDYYRSYWLTRPFGPEPWWAIWHRYLMAVLSGQEFRPDGPLLTDARGPDDEEYVKLIAKFHGYDDCCCCMEATGRWPAGLPHFGSEPEDVDLNDTKWQMPDGSRVTAEMYAGLAAMISKTYAEPSPSGTWSAPNDIAEPTPPTEAQG